VAVTVALSVVLFWLLKRHSERQARRADAERGRKGA